MSGSIRDNLAAGRLSRRRALAVTGGLGLSAALLVACGSDSSSSPTGQNTSSLLVKPDDTSKQAKRGGILKSRLDGDVTTWDPNQAAAAAVAHFEATYSRLFSRKVGHLQPSDNEITGELAESWEWSPDRLQLTAKLRKGVKFHNLAPVNGRVVDIDDVMFSWKRFSSQSVYRTIVSNAANPDAPVLSFTAPDPNTIVIKLKEPLFYAHGYFANRSYVVLMPKEADNPRDLDLRGKLVGTGPFFLDYKPSVGLSYKRHPDYWVKEQPYLDQIDMPLVAEYASALAQFRSGNIYGGIASQADILVTKKDVPALNLYKESVSGGGYRMFFGWQHAPVRDKRVRQAWSMAIDRDLLIETQGGAKEFEQAGLSVEKRWNSALQTTDQTAGWWLDPRGKDFGPNAKYYQYNVAEAKKLLAAAGYSDGPEMISNYAVGGIGLYGPDYVKYVDIWEGMAKDAGFKVTRKEINYTTDFLPKIRDSQGVFGGHSYKTGPPPPTSDPVNQLTYEYSKAGGSGFHGFDLGGKGDASGDPYIEDQLHKARLEADVEKRRSIVFDVQRYLAEQQYCIQYPGGSTPYSVQWPALRNYRVFFGGDGLTNVTNYMNWWVDDAQPPLKT